MRKFITTVAISLVCGMMFCPITEAQGRGRNNGGGNNGGGNTPRTETRQSNNNNRGSSSNNKSSRPGNISNNRGNASNNRPAGNISTPSSNRNNRPGNNVATGGNRPGGNMGVGSARPGNGGWNTHKGTQNPGIGNARPNYGGARHFSHGAPIRPYMPAHRTWYRPVAPARFTPYHGCPRFSTILGIALGSALDYTLDRLIGGGYNVLGYAADAIYLSNVSMFNYRWPNATMYYNDGALYGSEFTYSTLGYDRSRYTLIYNDLVRQYGSPVSVQNDGNSNISATWWGYDNRYVTLSYFSDYAQDGSLRYYTTLSFGN